MFKIGPNFVLDKGYVAAGAIPQFRAVKLNTKDTVVVTAAAADMPLGVCQEEISADDATNGRVGDIRLLGITRAVASGVIALSGRVIVGANGKVAAAAGATANQNQIGIALLASTGDNDHIDLFLTPGVQIDT